MTIRLPPENIIDKFLKLFGKERKIILSSNHAESSINGETIPTASICSIIL